MQFESCALFNILISNRRAFLGLNLHRLLIEVRPLLTPTAGFLSTVPAHSYHVNYSIRPATQLNMYFLNRDSAVGIATRYELDGPGIESRWWARFSAPVKTCPGAYPVSCTMGTRSFLGVKRPGAWC